MKQLKNQMAIQMAMLAIFFVSSAVSQQVVANGSSPDQFWNEHLRALHFKDANIVESDDIIQLHIPEQAEDPAVVPVSIYAMIPQTEERYIKAVSLVIDQNPVPLAGRFMFSPSTGRADLSLRIRINDMTPVRAIAELNDGSFHMSSTFVNASGGCSAPVLGDLAQAMSQAGKMKLSIGAVTAGDKPISSTLRIRHPNITGMQTVGGQFSPAQYIKKIKVRLNSEEIFSAETDISISEDPAFGFYIAPSASGQMIAEVTDSAGETFTKEINVKGQVSTTQ